MSDKHPLQDYLAQFPNSLVPLSPADAEREAVVRYLRACMPENNGDTSRALRWMIDAIERGDHLTTARRESSASPSAAAAPSPSTDPPEPT